MPTAKTTKKSCLRKGQNWVKTSTRSGIRIPGYCRKTRSRSRSRSRSRTTTRRRTRSRSRGSSPKYVYIYTRPVSPRRTLYTPAPRASPRRTLYTAPRYINLGKPCTQARTPSECSVDRCYWTGSSCLTK